MENLTLRALRQVCVNGIFVYGCMYVCVYVLAYVLAYDCVIVCAYVCIYINPNQCTL